MTGPSRTSRIERRRWRSTCRIIVPDLRGFGDSDKPEATPGIDDYVADLQAFVDHFELDRLGIVTHDVGAWIVQPFARQNPDRVAGIFFFDCPYPGVGTHQRRDHQVLQ